MRRNMQTETVHGERVTLSDCAIALNSIDAEIEAQKREKTVIERKLEALRTQGLVIRELSRRLS